MANGKKNKRAGGTGHRDQTTRANEPPIDLNTISPEELNCRGEALGKELAREITTNQIRNIYSAVQHIRVRASRPIPTPRISIAV